MSILPNIIIRQVSHYVLLNIKNYQRVTCQTQEKNRLNFVTTESSFTFWTTTATECNSFFFVKNRLHCYCPLRSCGKVMFLKVSVILFTLAGRHTPWADTPLPAGRHPTDTDTTAADGRILLECILVFNETVHMGIGSNSKGNAIKLVLHHWFCTK